MVDRPRILGHTGARCEARHQRIEGFTAQAVSHERGRIADVADTLVDALSGPSGRTLEAGTGVPVSVMQAARDVVEACRSGSEIVTGPMRPGEPHWSRVVAQEPHGNARPWPSLDDTISYYRRLIRVAA